eukprot:SAG31_NODE_49_length_30599_cov_15.615016_6_plen_76_part_00
MYMRVPHVRYRTVHVQLYNCTAVAEARAELEDCKEDCSPLLLSPLAALLRDSLVVHALMLLLDNGFIILFPYLML